MDSANNINMGGEETATEVVNEVNVEDSDDDYDNDILEDWSYLLDDDILQRLKQNDPSITALDLHYDAIEDGGFINGVDWQEEGEFFASNTNLKSLFINGDNDDSDTSDAEELYRAVSRNRSIHNLYLDGHHIGTGRVMELLSSLIFL